MRIQDLSVHVLAVPLEKPILPWRFQIANAHIVLAQLRTEDGLEGLGYCVLLNERGAAPLGRMIANLRDVVLDQDPTRPEAIWKLTSTAAYLSGPTGLALMAVAAIDVAVWDLFGKITNQPVSHLLGGARSELPAYALCPPTNPDPDAIAAEAQERVAQGFRAIKIFISGILGSGDPQEIAGRVRAVRKAIGPNIQLALDNEGMWKPYEAIRLGRLLEEYNLFWFEDPVYHSDFEGLREVSTALAMPVCAGESLYGLQTFQPLIKSRGVDIIMVELQRAGGITPFRKIAALAEASNKLIVNHMMTAVDTPVMAAIPNSGPIEYVPWTDRLFEEPIQVENGVILPPERPGIGYSLAPGVLKRFAV